jgi:hypothetical protein
MKGTGNGEKDRHRVWREVLSWRERASRLLILAVISQSLGWLFGTLLEAKEVAAEAASVAASEAAGWQRPL